MPLTTLWKNNQNGAQLCHNGLISHFLTICWMRSQHRRSLGPNTEQLRYFLASRTCDGAKQHFTNFWSHKVTELKLRGVVIDNDNSEMLCLDDVWRAAGRPTGRSPAAWRKIGSVQTLQIALYEKLFGRSEGYQFSKIIKQVSDPQRTFAHPILAVSYASFLSPKLAIEVKEVWLRYAKADPTLADEILQKASSAANEWAGARALARAKRREYTDTLQLHGVTGPTGYIQCTDAIYEQILGGPSWRIRSDRGLPKKVNLRDNLSLTELTFITASECLAKDRITEEESRGNTECEQASSRSAFFIRKAIEEDKADRRRQRLL